MSNEWSNRKGEIEDADSLPRPTPRWLPRRRWTYRHVLEQLQVAESGRDL